MSYVHMPQLYGCVFEFPIQLGCKGLNSKTSERAVSGPMPFLPTPCNLRYLMTRSRKHPPRRKLGCGCGCGWGMGMGNGVGEMLVLGQYLKPVTQCSKA